MSTVYILWLRQLKRFFRSKTRIIGSLGQPLLFLLALGFGFGPTFQKAGEGNYIQFLVPGIIAMTILFASVFSGIEIIWDKQFGFLKETLVAPVSRIYIMIGRTLGGATVAVMQGLIVLGISFAVGFRLETYWVILPALLVMFLLAMLFTAFGTALASTIEDMQGFQLIINFIIMPLFFLSGALFPMTGLPGIVGIIVKFNPLSYGVDGLRAALINVSHFGLTMDIMVLSIVSIVIISIGAWLFSRIEV